MAQTQAWRRLPRPRPQPDECSRPGLRVGYGLRPCLGLPHGFELCLHHPPVAYPRPGSRLRRRVRPHPDPRLRSGFRHLR